MATKQKRETRYDPPKPEFKGFIRCDLDDDQKARIKKQTPDVDKLFDSVEALVDAGYKFGFSRDNYNNCYQCSLTCNNKESPNYLWCLTGRGPNLGSALMVLLFKHFEVLLEAWPVGEDMGKTFDVWG